MSDYEQYCDFGSGAYDTFLARSPDFKNPEFEEFVIANNRADRDSGELQDISMEEVGRLAHLFKSRSKAQATAHAIASLTLDGKIAAAKLLLHTPLLKEAQSYYRHFKSLQDTIDRWQQNDEKLYDASQPVMVPVRELWPIREYTWTREEARLYPEEWDSLKKSVRREGWREDNPAIVLIGRAGGVKVGEGNHRLAISREAGIREVPVRFAFYEHRVTKTPQYSREERKRMVELEQLAKERGEKQRQRAHEEAEEKDRKRREKMTPEEQREYDKEIDNLMDLLGF